MADRLTVAVAVAPRAGVVRAEKRNVRSFEGNMV